MAGSRRDFFKTLTSVPPPAEMELLRVGRPAMGTRFEILFRSEHRTRIEGVHRALDEIRRLEQVMTVFSDESEISRLNQHAAFHPVTIGRDLFAVIRRGLEISQEVQGAFDPSAGALWKCWGFYRKQGAVPSPQELKQARQRCGAEFVHLDEADSVVRYARDGLELNLGSIGKGFALDRAARILQNAGLEEALLHAGHSSFLAMGDPSARGRGWRVSIRHPLEPEKSFAVLDLKEVGMATSGAGEQFFEVDGKRYGHIVDPRTGVPPDHILSATALAPDAAQADALATAFFVMSLDEIDDYCRRHKRVGAIVVPAASGESPLEMHCFGGASKYLVDR